MQPTTLTASPAFQALVSHYAQAREWQMRTLFAEQPQRFERFSTEAAGLLLDYSKNRINDTTLQLLLELAREREVEQRRDAMFAGEGINTTEERAVLHTALRAPRAVACGRAGCHAGGACGTRPCQRLHRARALRQLARLRR